MKVMLRIKQAGISLLEVMLSLSIIALILVMATKYFHVASNSQNLNRVRSQVGVIITAINHLKSYQADYSQINTTAIAQSAALKDSGDVTTAGDIKNPWASNITITPDASSTFVVLSTDLPSLSECESLKAGFASNEASCSDRTFELKVGTIVGS